MNQSKTLNLKPETIPNDIATACQKLGWTIIRPQSYYGGQRAYLIRDQNYIIEPYTTQAILTAAALQTEEEHNCSQCGKVIKHPGRCHICKEKDVHLPTVCSECGTDIFYDYDPDDEFPLCEECSIYYL